MKEGDEGGGAKKGGRAKGGSAVESVEATLCEANCAETRADRIGGNVVASAGASLVLVWRAGHFRYRSNGDAFIHPFERPVASVMGGN